MPGEGCQTDTKSQQVPQGQNPALTPNKGHECTKVSEQGTCPMSKGEQGPTCIPTWAVG